jgi:hypothetical protein
MYAAELVGYLLEVEKSLTRYTVVVLQSLRARWSS